MFKSKNNEVPTEIDGKEKRYKIRKEIYDLVKKLEQTLNEQLGFDLFLTEKASTELITRTREIVGDDKLWSRITAKEIESFKPEISTVEGLRQKMIALAEEHEKTE
jgi:threonyl-tRNA synthetase